MRATSSYHDKAWFSNIAILMDSEESNDYISDQGLCYGQVIHNNNNVFTKTIISIYIL
jgi:hypothetical protein